MISDFRNHLLSLFGDSTIILVGESPTNKFEYLIYAERDNKLVKCVVNACDVEKDIKLAASIIANQIGYMLT